MKLIESPHIFVMQQKIKTLEDESIDSIKDTDVARKLQIEAFGGRKSKQRLSTYVENRVSEDNASANFSSSISHSILAKITSDTDLLGLYLFLLFYFFILLLLLLLFLLFLFFILFIL